MAKVLVVDDEESQVRMLVAALRMEGFEATGTRDPEVALDMLGREPVDLALVDLMMPGMNGIELSRKIRDQFPGLPVVLTSAYHLSERQLSRADCGVVGFVPKPYVVPELATFLRSKITSAGVPSAAKSGSRLCAS